MPGSKGNTNALKHGLYAKQFRDDQRASLRKMAWDDHRHELNMFRTVAADVYRLLRSSLDSSSPNLDRLSTLVTDLSIAAARVDASARTHGLLNGTIESYTDALELALEMVPFDEHIQT